MTRSFETAGFWHVPNDPSRKVAGTLRYSPETGLHLALTGCLGEGHFGHKVGEYPVIHGVVHDSPFGKAFTLVDCFRTVLRVQMPGFAIEEISANHAYSGDHWLAKDDLLFDSAILELSTLGEWINTSGISCRPAGEQDGTIHMEYSRPKSISIPLGNQTIEIIFGWSRLQEHRSYSFTENVGIKISGFGCIPRDQIAQQFIYPLQHFLTLAADHPSAINHITLLRRDLNSADSERSTAFHYLAQPVYLLKETEKSIQPQDMLFTYEDVQDELRNLFEKWFDFARIFKPFCISYFGLLCAPDRFIDERFVTLVQSLAFFFGQSDESDESLHPVLKETERLLQSRCPDTKPCWLADVMPTAAELALPWSLLAALEKHRDVMMPLTGGDIEAFVDEVLTTRRYCLYRDVASRDRAALGAELFRLTEKVKILVKILILNRLGMSSDLVAKLMKRNRIYCHLAALADSD
jgi:hypothetical protein